MVPDTETRLKAMLRSVEEVIAPALPATERLALDQATILVENIKMLIAHHDKQFHYDMAELRDYSRLAGELLALLHREGMQCREAAGIQAALERGKPALDMQLPSPAALASQVLDLKSAVESLLEEIHEQAQPATKNAVGTIVLEHSERQLLRERAWFLKAGFDLDPDAVPPLDTLLAAQ